MKPFYPVAIALILLLVFSGCRKNGSMMGGGGNSAGGGGGGPKPSAGNTRPRNNNADNNLNRQNENLEPPFIDQNNPDVIQPDEVDNRGVQDNLIAVDPTVDLNGNNNASSNGQIFNPEVLPATSSGNPRLESLGGAEKAAIDSRGNQLLDSRLPATDGSQPHRRNNGTTLPTQSSSEVHQVGTEDDLNAKPRSLP